MADVMAMTEAIKVMMMIMRDITFKIMSSKGLCKTVLLKHSVLRYL